MSAPGGLAVAAQVRRGGFELDVDLAVAPGELLGVLGPNGAGKSTLLRAVAGLNPIRAGSVRLGDRVLDDGRHCLPPERRRVGVVFQDYRLFPHLAVRANVAFGPRSTGVGRRESGARADTWVERLGLGGLATRRPSELSGGQAQRVALARALAQEPDALLLDEPMAALDLAARAGVRAELRRHLGEFAGPAVLVTHDPLEAMILADRLLVLEHGRVVQSGTPAEVAGRPHTPYVARIMGLNLYAGRVADPPDQAVELASGGTLVSADLPDEREVLVAVRPTSITVHQAHPEGSSRNVWRGTVEHLELLGDRVRAQVTGRPGALVDLTPESVASLRLAPGSEVWLSAKATEVEVYPDPGAPRPAASGV
ncbi:MAG: ABC transporter ATP-binding protein [Marmoricola sp.]